MDYPGHVIKMGETDSALVDAVAKGLKKLGYPPAQGDFALQPGKFDAQFKSLVKLFQSQHVDALGRPLKADGEIGPITWGAIFNVREVGSPTPTGKKLRDKALATALTQDGVREKPLGSNKGKEVEAYLKSTGLGGGYFWCMAFVYWCFREAAAGGDNPFPKTASCIDAWNKAKDFASPRRKPSRSPRWWCRARCSSSITAAAPGIPASCCPPPMVRCAPSRATPIMTAAITASACSSSTAAPSWTAISRASSSSLERTATSS